MEREGTTHGGFRDADGQRINRWRQESWTKVRDVDAQRGHVREDKTGALEQAGEDQRPDLH